MSDATDHGSPLAALASSRPGGESISDAAAPWAPSTAGAQAAATADPVIPQREHGALLSALAHDLRNPLAPLSNGLALLRLGAASPAQRDEVLSLIERQVTRLVQLADGIAELALVAGGETVPQRARLDLLALLDGLADRLRPRLQAANGTLAIEPPVSPFVLEVDGARLGDALARLIGTLIPAAMPSGTARVTARPASGGVELTLSRGESSAASRAPGTAPGTVREVVPAGLGLDAALAARWIALERGRLQAFRADGQRIATFRVWLPATPA